jgi:hypothetical protein
MTTPEERLAWARNMTPAQLLEAAQTVVDRVPDARLLKNAVGNLTIVDPDDNYIGYIDLRFGDVELFP